jgi:competence protein ComEC
VQSDHISQYIAQDSQLVEVIGVIDSRVQINPPQRGAFAKFSYQQPTTGFTIKLSSILIAGQHQSTTGNLLAKIRSSDLRLKTGMIVRCRGWLSGISGPANPGELDFRMILKRRSIAGRLTMKVTGNCLILSDLEQDKSSAPGTMMKAKQLRQGMSDAAGESLRLGMTQNSQRISFLDAILLGRRSGQMHDTRDSFRQVGLAHLLSISGAHLGILIILVWWVARAFVSHPAKSTCIVLAVLMLYMLTVPLRVPIVRAGIMAGLLTLGFASGRRVRATDMIALSAIVLLIYQPKDLFTAGFQLSFGIVAGLMLYATPLAHRLWPEPIIKAHEDRIIKPIRRFLAGLLAANIVAFVIATPLVAYHFKLVSPLSAVLSTFAFFIVAAVLGMGYFKIIIGLVLPSIGIVLAGGLEWIADILTGLVTHASHWPGAYFELAQSPSLIWVICTLAIGIAWLQGWFKNRTLTIVLATATCIAWLITANHWPNQFHNASNQNYTHSQTSTHQNTPATVNMFAVGDGSCFLIRINDCNDEQPKRSTSAAMHKDSQVILFDCGSQAFLDVVQSTISPALAKIGVTHIDTLIISHADLDHFGGVLDLIEKVDVGRILAPPQLLTNAAKDANSASFHLVESLRAKDIIITPVARGHTETWAGAKAHFLWPPTDYKTKRTNDTSLVLSLKVPCASPSKLTRRILLNGDSDHVSLPLLLNTETNLKADITDLPHHGSFTPSSEAFLSRTNPTIALQSCGPRKLDLDPWQTIFQNKPHITRLITATHGMVEVTIDRKGAINYITFSNPRY